MNWKEKQHNTSRYSKHNKAFYTWCSRKWLCYPRWRAYRSNACLCSTTSLSKYARSQEHTHSSTSVDVCIAPTNQYDRSNSTWLYIWTTIKSCKIHFHSSHPSLQYGQKYSPTSRVGLSHRHKRRASNPLWVLFSSKNHIEALNQWNPRSAPHFEYVQPALAASKVPNGGIITKEGLDQKILGVHTFGSIVNSTENCIISLQRAFQKLSDVKTKARKYLVSRFKIKGNDFTDFEFAETYGLVPPEALRQNSYVKFKS